MHTQTYYDMSFPELQPFDSTNAYLRFELFVSNDYLIIERTNYTVLQFIGDVGALSDTLIKIFAFVLAFFFRLSYLLDSHLFNGVFRQRKQEDTILYPKT